MAVGKLARIVENADGCKQMAASSSTAHLKITKTHTKGLTKGQMTILVGKLQAHAASTDISVISAADAKSMAGFKPGLDKFASELCAAE